MIQNVPAELRALPQWVCYDETKRPVDPHWRSLAWWINDHLDYSELVFFPKLCAFNIAWHERPKRTINSHIAPKGFLVAPGDAIPQGGHERWYQGFPKLVAG